MAQGFRRDIPKHWPAALSELVMDCWAHDPTLRPTALEVRLLVPLRDETIISTLVVSLQVSMSSTWCREIRVLIAWLGDAGRGKARVAGARGGAGGMGCHRESTDGWLLCGAVKINSALGNGTWRLELVPRPDYEDITRPAFG